MRRVAIIAFLLGCLIAALLMLWVGKLHFFGAVDTDLEGTRHLSPKLEKSVDHETEFTGSTAVKADIRSLYALQDATTMGRAGAVTSQESMLTVIGQKFRVLSGTTDPNSIAPSVLAYVLSGGNQEVVETFIGVKGLDPMYVLFLKGALLHMRGEKAEAADLLKHADILPLPPQAAGRMALVKAMLSNSGEIHRQAMLSVSISLLPGSLVEDSALRRSALFYAEAGNQSAFWRRAQKYLRRFPHSIYAPDFMSQVIGTFVSWSQKGMKPSLSELDLLMNHVALGERRRLYLELTRKAAWKNLEELAKLGARRLRRLSLERSQEHQIADLYDVLFDVASSKPEEASSRLRKLNPDIFPSLEKSLLEAALMVANQILAPVRPSTEAGSKELDQAAQTDVERRVLLAIHEADRLTSKVEK